MVSVFFFLQEYVREKARDMSIRYFNVAFKESGHWQESYVCAQPHVVGVSAVHASILKKLKRCESVKDAAMIGDAGCRILLQVRAV